MIPGADKYRRRCDGVPGWFWPEDFDLFDRILAAQFADGISGDILEIGCYHGKSAILLGFGLRDTEDLVVVDLFGQAVDTAEQTDVFEDGFGVSTFTTNYGRWHDRAPIIHAGSSLDVDLDADRYRFVHVDGGHSFDVARHDIELAYKYSCAATVIAIDDYRTHHTPGVPAAIWEATSRRKLFPFALSETKVYATVNKTAHAFWLDIARDWNLPNSEEHDIMGCTVLRTTRGRNL